MAMKATKWSSFEEVGVGSKCNLKLVGDSEVVHWDAKMISFFGTKGSQTADFVVNGKTLRGLSEQQWEAWTRH